MGRTQTREPVWAKQIRLSRTAATTWQTPLMWMHTFSLAQRARYHFHDEENKNEKKNYVGIRNKRAVVVDGDSGHAEMEWNIKWNKKKACTKCRCVAVLPVRAMINGKQTFISVAEMFAVKHHYVCLGHTRLCQRLLPRPLSSARGVFFLSRFHFVCYLLEFIKWNKWWFDPRNRRHSLVKRNAKRKRTKNADRRTDRSVTNERTKSEMK